MAAEDGKKIIAANRKARYEYEILETFDAGMVLTGTEIKSLRAGKLNMGDAFARVQSGEMWLHNMHIAPYEQGNIFNVESRRARKLLLHKSEINRMMGKVNEKGLTIVPLKVYLQRGYAKVEIGLAKGKKIWDKRDDIAKRDTNRDAAREIAQRGR